MANLLVVCSLFLIVAAAVSAETPCKNLEVIKLNATDRKLIVENHNRYRSLVSEGKLPGQPRAKNMPDLKWDDALAQKADEVVRECPMGHIKKYDDRFGQLGQSLWAAMGKDPTSLKLNWQSVVNSWGNEHKFYKYPAGPGRKTGHYTQIVWDTTRLVGCAASRFVRDSGRLVVICHYGPAGNVVDTPPYEKYED